mmetsp:Transcript_43215/g.101466  ORF Transcript_43215/g.101466 Transcript_43215/m.101466 type:complete len:236 (-) Transcript_43215:140-847(-)
MQRPGTLVPLSAAPKGVWETADFGWLRLLEAQCAEVQLELDALLPQRQSSRGSAEGAWHAVGGVHREMGQHDGSVVDSGAWREAVLLGTGARPQLAPRTVALLRAHAPAAVDLCERGAGEVILSVLAPGTHIRAHCAPSNLRLTAHLGLRVPPSGSGRCELRVGARTLRWEEGRALVFDDSFEHEVFNLTAHTRVVLLIRFWHPELATDDARDAALRQAADHAHACWQIRHHPPR